MTLNVALHSTRIYCNANACVRLVKIIDGKMAPFTQQQKLAMLQNVIAARRRRERLQQAIISSVLRRRHQGLQVCMLLLLILTALQSAVASMPERRARSSRRLPRNKGWWDLVWTTYLGKRFKKTFRVSRETFLLILDAIRGDIEKENVSEAPVPPDMRLGICLYRLGRVDYYHTIAELAGLGEATVCNIVRDVSKTSVERLLERYVEDNFPRDEEQLIVKMEEMEQEWQFPYAYAAIDGCHIPIKCPAGGLESSKEFHNFKNFYSIVLIAMIDAKYKFVWASAGWPGNSHDAIIFQATDLYKKLSEDRVLPYIVYEEKGTKCHPMILCDSAFSFKSWLMKPYTNAVLTAQQRYFNYRLSRARMVSERAYGKFKGRWRVLLRKAENVKETVHVGKLACVVLHNICIECGDVAARNWDLTVDPATNQRRTREEVRETLVLTHCAPRRDTNREAALIRDCLKDKFYSEKKQTLEAHT